MKFNLLAALTILLLNACAHYAPNTSEAEAEAKGIDASQLEEKPKEVEQMERQMQRNRLGL